MRLISVVSHPTNKADPMPVLDNFSPTHGDNESRSLQKINGILYDMHGADPDGGPYTNLAPTHGDTRQSSLVKINSILKLIYDGGGFGGGGSVPTAPGIGMGYGYFAVSTILPDGTYQLINTIPDAGGVYGNAALFNAVPNGIEVAQPVIVSVMLWAKDNVPQTTERQLAVQLDKQKGTIDPSLVLTRVPTGFIWHTATAIYQGILLPGDIVRGVATAPVGGDSFSIVDGYASVLGVPISL